MVRDRALRDVPNIAEREGAEEAAAERKHFVAQLRDAMSAGVPVRAPRPVGSVDAGTAHVDHEWARAVVLAQRAAEDDDVRAFRAEHLPGGLRTSTAELRAWLGEMTPTEPVRVTRRRGEAEWETTRRLAERVGPVVRLVTFEGEPLEVRACRTEPLTTLYDLAAQLGRRYGWEPETAATFLLAGGVPESPMISVQVAAGLLPWSARVELAVHPDTPVSSVAAAYAAAQRQVSGGERARLVSAEVARAVVAASMPLGSPAQRHAAYVDAGGRAYDSPRNFVAVTERARRKLLGVEERSEGAAAMRRIRRMLAG